MALMRLAWNVIDDFKEIQIKVQTNKNSHKCWKKLETADSG